MPALIWMRSGYRSTGGFAVHQRDGVHTVAQSSWRRSVIEDMSEMRSAMGARNFHSEDRRGRAAFVNRFFTDRLPSVQLRPYLRYIGIAGMRAGASGKCNANTHA